MSGDERVKRLRRLDACAVSDAMDRLGLSGAVTSLRRLSGHGSLAGIATTLRVAPGDPPPGPARHLGTRAVELSGPDHVIVVEQVSGVDAGCWGGLLTLGAKVRGVAGVVADGPIRDLDEARGYAFPIFGNATTSLTARGRVVEKETNGPVVIGGVRVEGGYYVLADESGVIFIPPHDIDRVLEASEAIVSREAAMAKAILAGTPISEVMGGAYEHMLSEGGRQ
jgi:4-hydroxy-4-methyl-2-oxoglutarate aldolase